MGSASLTGDDTTILNNRIMKDFGDGDCVALVFPNDLVEATVGKNKNTIYAFNAKGQLSEVTMRVILGSDDDKYLNSLATSYIRDPAGFTLITGEFVKRSGDGNGNVNNVSYIFGGGVVKKLPETKENVSGETEQALAIYKLVFANTDRGIA